MVENIRTAFKTMLGKTTWMDTGARSSAIAKVGTYRWNSLDFIFKNILYYVNYLYNDMCSIESLHNT